MDDSNFSILSSRNETKVFKIAALYHFTLINEKNLNNIQTSLLKLCLQEQIRGTLLLAHEGINGTIAGIESSIDKVITYISSLPEFGNKLNIKYSYNSNCNAFSHIKVKIKNEIVTMGKPDLNIFEHTVGTYIEPSEWNELIKKDNVILIDTRNDYEIQIGTFKNAINPKTKTFKDFPDWADKYISERIHNNNNINNTNVTISNSNKPFAHDDMIQECESIVNSDHDTSSSLSITTSERNTATASKGNSLKSSPPIIAMYCTGGIRCEKATAYIKQLTNTNRNTSTNCSSTTTTTEGEEGEVVDVPVYHLKGGILKYLETIPREDSLWQGECFVFDERVSVTHGLEPGTYTRCFACKMPLHTTSKSDITTTSNINSSIITSSNISTDDITCDYEEGVWCKYCIGKQTPAQTKRFRERQLQITLANSKGTSHLGQDIDSIIMLQELE